MIPIIVLGLAFLAGCGSAVVESEKKKDQKPEDKGGEPSGEPSIEALAPFEAQRVCPEESDDSSVVENGESFSALSDDSGYACVVHRWDRDADQTSVRAQVHRFGERAPIWTQEPFDLNVLFPKVNIHGEEGRMMLTYHDGTNQVIHHIAPEEERIVMDEVSGCVVSADGTLGVMVRDDKRQAFDPAEPDVDSVCRFDAEEVGLIKGLANDGTLLLGGIRLVTDVPNATLDEFLDSYYVVEDSYLSNSCSGENRMIADSRRWPCMEMQRISDDGSTIAITNACDPHLLVVDGEASVLAVPPEGAEYLHPLGMSANGRTICFATAGDYLLYDAVDARWTNVRGRFPLALDSDSILTVACEVASLDGVEGALYFADSEAGMHFIYRADLRDVWER